MCEPLSVGVHACRRANIGPETNVLVMGAGPIGLVTMLAARAFGAPRIVIVDVDDHRLSVAKELGADEIVKVSPNIQVFIILFYTIFYNLIYAVCIRSISHSQVPPPFKMKTTRQYLHLVKLLNFHYCFQVLLCNIGKDHILSI